MKEMKVNLVLILLVSKVFSYDNTQKVCWDVRLQNSSMFCYDQGNNGVVWALSEDVFYSAQQRDNCKTLISDRFSGCREVLKFIETLGKWDGN